MKKNRYGSVEEVEKLLQEIVFSSTDNIQNKKITKLLKNGKIRKIAPRIYTSNLIESPKAIIRRNILWILGSLYPGAVLSHRSALEYQPTISGDIFITFSYSKNIELPGVTIRILKGNGPINGDTILIGQLYVAQVERALLENFEVSRKKGTESKSIGISEIEKRLDQIINIKGEQGLNILRDKAKTLATQLNLQAEYEKLNKIISALLSTHPSHMLTSPLARARAFGQPYDINRITIFQKLFIDLKNGIYLELKDTRNDLSFKNISFFESYFSNYIEGTEFEIEEALKIIDSGSPMQMRNEDSHDILGTYQLVSNRFEMNRIPMNSIDLVEILLHRHKILLGARAHKNPGSFKDKNNRAGDTQFVDYKLVRGTLEKGYDYYQALDDPFARACFMMFLISEVHPFLDGNGRIARVMMNAELVHRGQSKIIIPTVYRDDYMLALRKLSRQEDTKAYLIMMRRAHLFSATILGNDFNEMKQILTASNAFKSSDDARLKIKGD